jgi:putative DNA methylase
MDNAGSAGASPAAASLGWHSRGYLPHFDGGEIAQSITYHLADSLPKKVLDQLLRELVSLAPEEAQAEKRRRLEKYLDKGHGNAWLRKPCIAQYVEDTLLRFDGERYRLHAWVIMPNHVHILSTPCQGWSLSSIVQFWKSCTAKYANAILSRSGKFWQEDYFDRYIRDERHFYACLKYIEANPVKAGLCQNKEQWVYGSAEIKFQRKEAGEAPALPA